MVINMVNERMIKKLKKNALRLRRKIDKVKDRKKKEQLLKEFTYLIYEVLELPNTCLFYSYSPNIMVDRRRLENVDIEERKRQASKLTYLTRS